MELNALDKLDKDLLYELSNNCRQTDSTIAKKLLKSKEVIRYRTKRLEEKGIISSYNGLINFRALGFNSLRIYFKLRNISPEEEKEMFEEMKNNDLFLWSVQFEGDVDVGFYVWIKKIENFYEKWEEFFQKYRKYIGEQNMYLSINMIHYPFKIFKQEKEIPEWNIGACKEQKIDKTDFEILKILSRKANLPTIKIAQEIGVSAKVVAYRIKQLEKNKIILSYNAIINEKKIGYQMFKVDFYLFNHVRLLEMYEFAKNHPNIKNIMKTVGGPDFEIEVFVKDINELRKLIDEIRTEFSEIIDEWKFNRVVKTIKQVYMPIEI